MLKELPRLPGFSVWPVVVFMLIISCSEQQPPQSDDAGTTPAAGTPDTRKSETVDDPAIMADEPTPATATDDALATGVAEDIAPPPPPPPPPAPPALPPSTLPAPVTPAVTVAGPTGTTFSSAGWTGVVTHDGGDTVTSRGIVWSSSTDPGIRNYEGIVMAGEGPGAFEAFLEELQPATAYHLRAWAVNSAGTGYSEPVTFTTPPAPPSVTTGTVTRITTDSSLPFGRVTDNGGAAITARGVVYCISPATDLENNLGVTLSGKGTGEFSAGIELLHPSTRYFVRAYATNAAGTSYGDPVPFTTIDRCGSDVTFTYRGKTVTYGTVEGHDGTCWMDRNLGASRPADYHNDSEAFGDLFQWGRSADGHQDPSSDITHLVSRTYRPDHVYFISTDSAPYDWLSSPNHGLWQGDNAANNVCPAGWRLPNRKEWRNEIRSWSRSNRRGALGSPLKLPAAGVRSHDNSLNDKGMRGYYWSSDGEGDYAQVLMFTRWFASMNTGTRASGRSVRCIREEVLMRHEPDLVTYP